MIALLVHRQAPPARARRGFTMTELMVVIGVIAVLAGILLAAMRGVRMKAMETRTVSTMQQLAQACEAFQLEHNRYPGLIPEAALAAVAPDPEDAPPISGTENALLELMGGACRTGPSDPVGSCDDYGFDPDEFPLVDIPIGDWDLKFDVNLMGGGPQIDGTPYGPYFTPNDRDLVRVRGQVGGQAIPDLVDAWGQPIMYLRRARSVGPLVGGYTTGGNAPPPQFYAASLKPYTLSEGLGDAGRSQNDLSILNTPSADQNATLAQIIRHPGMGGSGTAAQVQSATPRGSFCLFSAGPDGVYFSVQDGPGSSSDPIDDIVTNDEQEYNNPQVVEDYDDIRIFGGG